MDSYDPELWEHDHGYRIDDGSNERRTSLVVVLTVVTMAAEIAAGYLFGSMALLADGWHMGTHATALGIAVFAYRYARNHKDDRRFSFGTGKVGSLGGFGSSILLGVVALSVVYESVERLITPRPIHYTESILVALLGLLVNLVSAFILRDHHDHHDHHPGQEQDHGPAHSHQHDHNMRAAYLHVVADALTSVLAIVALLAGKYFGWAFMDPVMGLVGSVLIARWAVILARESGAVLLDSSVDLDLIQEIKEEIERFDDHRVSDLHVWKIGTKQLAAIVSVVTQHPKPPEYFKGILAKYPRIVHLAVEVNSGERLL
ncbi:MAG: CDF family Co(II)/Ni(II) efflux transporter DmeF [bacterium]|nr:CDF family Co(II)/Ni(II) efflux transporter DmeF [bacterium]